MVDSATAIFEFISRYSQVFRQRRRGVRTLWHNPTFLQGIVVYRHVIIAIGLV